MKLNVKFFLPIFVAVALLGAIGVWVIRTQLNGFEIQVLHSMAEEKSREVNNAVATLAAQGLEKAALFSARTDVIQAFELAHLGNIDNESDPLAQQAREELRVLLKDDLAGFKNASGKAMELHFHLGNGRSLVRMWREKQTKRDGKWVDISDDISSFRQTVMEVNREGKTVQGVELGSGGFAIRGIAPVKDAQGRQLGSVETLESFDSVIQGAAAGPGQSIVVYMNAEFLPITTALQDPSKNPVVGEEFVLVTPSKDGELERLVSLDFLRKGQRELAYARFGSRAVAAFPLFDYAKKQTGVMVYAFDASGWNASIARVGWYFLGLMALLMTAAGVTTSLALRRFVTLPISGIVRRIVDISEDRADLRSNLPVRSKDEIGELATWFNTLMGKIHNAFSDVVVYKNLVNTINDPVFAVDKDFKIIVANAAMLEIAGCTAQEITSKTCHSILNTAFCGTNDCPIRKAMDLGESFTSDPIEISVRGQARSIQPMGGVLRDVDDTVLGYFEIARDVTELAERERGLQTTMQRMKSITANILNVGQAVAHASRSLSERVEQVVGGTREQSQRLGEVSAAMNQMNSAVLDVARSASDAAKAADSSSDKAQRGARIVDEVVMSIGQVHERTENLSVQMAELGNQAESIGRVMNVISDIADQTNLLALNAAIEAARAGDAGRGFAVVADEVRKLAEKTMIATKEVGQAIADIQNGTKQNIAGMRGVAEQVLATTDLAKTSGTALAEIVPLVENTTVRITAIATASEEQSSASEEVTGALGMVNEIAATTAAGMEQAAEAIAELSRLAEELRRLGEDGQR